MDKYIGIDVAKATLQVYIPRNSLELEIENSPKGLKQLYSKIKKQYKKELSEVIFVYEPTGSYSTLLDCFIMAHNILCFKVKPAQSSAFAKTLDHRNKSDRIDAKLLHRIGILAKESDISVIHIDEDAHHLQSMFKYYRRVLKDRISASNYLEASLLHQEDPFILKRLRANIKRLQKEADDVLQRMLDFINTHEQYKEAFENIISIKGIGENAGIALLYLFLRYPDASRSHITALCGLDPIIVQSGTSVNKRSRISKQGNRAIREILFMPTLSALAYNDEMKTFYNRLKDNGKHSTAAQMAVMRKLILLAHSLYKNKEKYDPKRYMIFQQPRKEKAVVHRLSTQYF